MVSVLPERVANVIKRHYSLLEYTSREIVVLFLYFALSNPSSQDGKIKPGYAEDLKMRNFWRFFRKFEFTLIFKFSSQISSNESITARKKRYRVSLHYYFLLLKPLTSQLADKFLSRRELFKLTLLSIEYSDVRERYFSLRSTN